MFVQVLKTVALFFLIQAALTYISSVSIALLLPKLPARRRAGFAVRSLAFGVALAIVFSGTMAALAHTNLIRMITPYFQLLMHGGAEKAISFAGLLGLFLSLLSSYLFIKFGKAPGIKKNAGHDRFLGLTVVETDAVAGAALVGAMNPFIAVSRGLTGAERELALIHEYSHYRLRHNWMKLFIRAVLRLNMFNLPLHRIARQFDLLCEHACDAYAAKIAGPEYARFLTGQANRASDMLELEARLGALAETAPEPDGKDHKLVLACSYLVAAAAVLIPVAAMTIDAVPRCVIICFLGF